jgi:glycerol kinase
MTLVDRLSGVSEQIACSVNGNAGVYLVPAFVGLGAPYWDHVAQACISGMGRYHQAHCAGGA